MRKDMKRDDLRGTPWRHGEERDFCMSGWWFHTYTYCKARVGMLDLLKICGAAKDVLLPNLTVPCPVKSVPNTQLLHCKSTVNLPFFGSKISSNTEWCWRRGKETLPRLSIKSFTTHAPRLPRVWSKTIIPPSSSALAYQTKNLIKAWKTSTSQGGKGAA